MRAVIGPLAVAALAILPVACTSSTTGSAQPQPNGDASQHPSTTAPGTAGGYGAPRVTHPLDTTKWQSNPCSTLTATQLSGLDITQPGQVTQDPKGNLCDWKPQLDVDYTFGFNTAYDANAAKGLANIYEFAPPNSMRRLPDIDGVLAVTQPSGNTNGSCTIYLGATDEVTYAVAVNISPGLPHYGDPCTPAQTIAEDVTETMKSG